MERVIGVMRRERACSIVEDGRMEWRVSIEQILCSTHTNSLSRLLSEQSTILKGKWEEVYACTLLRRE